MIDNENLWPIKELFQLEALTLSSAREKTRLIHNLKNIRSAGDEVEEAVRDFFRRRMAKRCRIGQGHVIDKNGHVSPQLDMVLHDGLDFPSLQENRDQTQYFPYESIFAIAEIKSTYKRSKDSIAKFSKMIEEVFKKKMYREATPLGFVSTGFGTGVNLGPALNLTSKKTYLNPLFSFMFFVNSGDFQLEDIETLYEETPRQFLPNMLCFLDKGVVLLSKDPEIETRHYEYDLFPEFQLGSDYVWSFSPNSQHETLALTWAILADVLTQIVLLRPHYLTYVSRAFELNDEPLKVLGRKTKS